MVQRWEAEDVSLSTEINSLTWLDGGSKIAYRNLFGLEMYDFEKNLKYRWGPTTLPANDWDHLDEYVGWGFKTFVLKKRGWIGTVDGDHKVRFWPYPA